MSHHGTKAVRNVLHRTPKRRADDLIADDGTKRALWSGVEISVAIVCANLAILRPILKYFFTGKSSSTARSGTTSEANSSGTGKSFRHWWTWRHFESPALQGSNDGRFHRLEPHPGAMSTDDVELQTHEGYKMSSLTSPVHSPGMPETAHL